MKKEEKGEEEGKEIREEVAFEKQSTDRPAS